VSSTSFRPRSTGRHVSDLAFIAYQELARSSPERSKPTLRAFVAGQADRRSSRMIVKADPYSWPHDAKMEPATTAVIVIDMQVSDAPPPPVLAVAAVAPAADVVQVDFVGKGGYVDMMGYDLAAMQAPMRPIQCAPCPARWHT